MIYKLADLLGDSMQGLNKPQQAERILVYLLEANKSYNEKTCLKWNDILNRYREFRNKHKAIAKISENSLYLYTMSFVKESASPICQAGHGKGFYVDSRILQSESDDDSDSERTVQDVRDTTNSYSERNMYPILVDWLYTNLGRTNELYGVKDVSSARGMGKWNNPDILGITKRSFFGTLSLEIFTIEAKVDWKNWRKDIFEAVAHTILANRSYFAFLRKKSDKVEEGRDMIMYAQKFGVGVLEIVVSDDDWGKPLSYEIIENFDTVVPAPYHSPEVRVQKRFLASLDIKEIDDIDKFFRERP